MLLTFFSFMVVYLALGAALLNCMLYYIAYLIKQRKGLEIPQHYFVVARGPFSKALADQIIDRFTNGMLKFYLFLLSCVVIWVITFQIVLCFYSDQLVTVIEKLHNISMTMPPVLISLTIFFASIRKKQQPFFDCDSHIQRHKSLFIASIGCWGLSLVPYPLFALDMFPALQPYLMTFELIFLAATILLSIIAAFVGINLSFLPQPIDLVQFKKFDLHRHDTPWDLWTCNYPSKQALSFSQKHLIMSLQKQTARLEKRLKHHCCIHKADSLQVFFSDAEHMRPVWYKRLSILIWLPLMWFTFGTIFLLFLLFLSVCKINIFALAPGNIVLLQASSVLLLSLTFFCRTKPCRQIAVYNTYGSWGYYFTDRSTSKTVYSFSERDFLFSSSKAWLRAVWCILTLFRIELIHADRASYVGFLSDLKAAAGMVPGLQSEMLKVTYCLCCRLGKDEYHENGRAFQELALSPFAEQFCSAIWMDYTRCAFSPVENNV